MIPYFANIDISRSAGVIKGDSFRLNMHNEAITKNSHFKLKMWIPNSILNYQILSDELKDDMRNVLVP